MKRLFGVFLFLPAVAMAVGIGNDNPGGAGVSSSAAAGASAQAAALSASMAASRSSVKANQSVGQSVIVSPSQSVSVSAPGGISQNGTDTLRTVADVNPPIIGVTAPCHVAYSGGVTVVGFGAAMGGSVEDTGCTLRETARILYAIGQRDAAAKIMCANPQAAIALGEVVCPQPKAITAGKCWQDEIIAERMGAPVCK